MSIEDGCGVGCDEVFALFRASGYLRADREAALAPVMADVTRTFAAAYARPSDVFQALVAREAGDLIGHVSSVRAYGRTWMSQHLVAAPSKHVAHLLCLESAARLLQDPSLEFFKVWYQEHNSWPRRVFGGFARTVTDRERSDLRSFRHVTMALDGELPDCPGELEVVEAGEAERGLVARHFSAREPELFVRADDLDLLGLPLTKLGESFAAAGMARRRAILAVMGRGAFLGFALVELSSPGLNLYEILSTFRLFVLPAGAARAPEVRRALLAGVARFYLSAGRANAHGLVASDEVRHYGRIRLRIDEETWTCWTFDRQTFEQFRSHVDRLFACLRRRGVHGDQ